MSDDRPTWMRPLTQIVGEPSAPASAPAPDAIDLSDPDAEETDASTVIVDISVPDGIDVVFIVNGVKLL